MKISADVFGAFLKCSTKCWLRAGGERTSANEYAEWAKSQNESYRADAAKRLMADVPSKRMRCRSGHGESEDRQVASGRGHGSLYAYRNAGVQARGFLPYPAARQFPQRSLFPG